MKRLLNKTIRPFALFSLLILLISIPVYFFIINNIWQEELDEHHQITKEKTELELNALTDSVALMQTFQQFNYLSTGGKIYPLQSNVAPPDSVYSYYRFDAYHKEEERFRALRTTLYIHGKPYRFAIETNIEESDETVLAIAMVTLSFFVLLLAGFFYLNRRLSKTLWQPFYKTLASLKSFELSGETAVDTGKSNIVEFEELNGAIDKLISKNIATYKQQKEFTENASHELQTPLAILKSKIDLLLQDETLTQEQAEKIAALNVSLSRASRVNKNLLLLSKIESQQIDDAREMIPLQDMIDESLGFLQDQILSRNITVKTQYTGKTIVSAGKNLAEMVVMNLLLNAIKHNVEAGKIDVVLSEKELTISNSGPEPLNPDALFKRFSSASRTTAGSGLGLAIVKEICSRYKWQVSYAFRDGFHFFTVRF